MTLINCQFTACQYDCKSFFDLSGMILINTDHSHKMFKPSIAFEFNMLI